MTPSERVHALLQELKEVPEFWPAPRHERNHSRLDLILGEVGIAPLFTQREVAEILGLTRAGVSYIENLIVQKLQEAFADDYAELMEAT